MILRELAGLSRISSATNDDPADGAVRRDHAAQLSDRLHADFPTLPLLALYECALSALRQDQVHAAIGTGLGIADGVAPPFEGFADEPLKLPPIKIPKAV